MTTAGVLLPIGAFVVARKVWLLVLPLLAIAFRGELRRVRLRAERNVAAQAKRLPASILRI